MINPFRFVVLAALLCCLHPLDARGAPVASESTVEALASIVPDAGPLVVVAQVPDVPVVVAPSVPSNGVIAWLRAGSPAPNWQILAFALWLAITAFLKRSANVRANEPLELIANVLVRVPLVGAIARGWTTPPVDDAAAYAEWRRGMQTGVELAAEHGLDVARQHVEKLPTTRVPAGVPTQAMPGGAAVALLVLMAAPAALAVLLFSAPALADEPQPPQPPPVAAHVRLDPPAVQPVAVQAPQPPTLEQQAAAAAVPVAVCPEPCEACAARGAAAVGQSLPTWAKALIGVSVAVVGGLEALNRAGVIGSR